MDDEKEFIKNLGTPIEEHHDSLTAEHLIAEALDCDSIHHGDATAFLHGMLAGMKMGGKK